MIGVLEREVDYLFPFFEIAPNAYDAFINGKTRSFAGESLTRARHDDSQSVPPGLVAAGKWGNFRTDGPVTLYGDAIDADAGWVRCAGA